MIPMCQDRIFANGDGQFVYPCTDGPCGGVRLADPRADQDSIKRPPGMGSPDHHI